jgi:hypothetical protein
MSKHGRPISSALVTAVAVAGLTLGTACGSSDGQGSTPAPKGETTTEGRRRRTSRNRKGGASERTS